MQTQFKEIEKIKKDITADLVESNGWDSVYEAVQNGDEWIKDYADFLNFIKAPSIWKGGGEYAVGDTAFYFEGYNYLLEYLRSEEEGNIREVDGVYYIKIDDDEDVYFGEDEMDLLAIVWETVYHISDKRREEILEDVVDGVEAGGVKVDNFEISESQKSESTYLEMNIGDDRVIVRWSLHENTLSSFYNYWIKDDDVEWVVENILKKYKK